VIDARSESPASDTKFGSPLDREADLQMAIIPTGSPLSEEFIAP